MCYLPFRRLSILHSEVLGVVSCNAAGFVGGCGGQLPGQGGDALGFQEADDVEGRGGGQEVCLELEGQSGGVEAHHPRLELDFDLIAHTLAKSQVAERLGNQASNQKVAGSGLCKITLCPWARHFTLLASGECPCTYCKSLWIRASAK